MGGAHSKSFKTKVLKNGMSVENMYVVVQESGYYSDYDAEAIEVHVTVESANRSIEFYKTNALVLQTEYRYKIQEVPVVDTPEDGFEDKLSLRKKNMLEAQKAKEIEDKERRQQREKTKREAEERTALEFLDWWKEHQMTFQAGDLDRYKDIAMVIQDYALWSGDKDALDWCRMVGKIW